MEMRGIPQKGISLSAFRYKHTYVSLEGRAYTTALWEVEAS